MTRVARCVQKLKCFRGLASAFSIEPRRAVLLLCAPMRRVLQLACLLLPCLVASAADKPAAAPLGVTVQNHRGWEGSLVLNAPEPGALVIVVPAIGGRVVHYSVRGENILWEDTNTFGHTLATTPAGLRVGGYQLDIGPELRNPRIPRHDALWVGPHQGVIVRDYTVRVTSPPDAATGVQLEKEITLDPDTGEVGLTQRIRNLSVDREVSFCLWDRTLCNGGGFAFFPLARRSRFAAGWSLKSAVGDTFAYDGAKPVHPNVKLLDGVLVSRCEGERTKLGADSDAGWIAYARGRHLFVKYYPHYAGANYSDGGNSVELYFDHRAELEPLSPEVKLKPGEQWEFPELWRLIRLDRDAASHADARALVKRVPPSPFKK